MNWIEKTIKPLLEREYDKGYTAGVAAEKLVKAQADTQREYDLFRRGVVEGKRQALEEIANADIEELSPTEFNELMEMSKEEPFGFTGPIDDLELVLR